MIAVFVGQSGSDVDPSALAAQTGPTDNSPQGASGGSSGSTSISNKQGGAGGSASVLLLNGQTFAVAGAGGGAISNADGGSCVLRSRGRDTDTSAADQPCQAHRRATDSTRRAAAGPRHPLPGSPQGVAMEGQASARWAAVARTRLIREARV